MGSVFGLLAKKKKFSGESSRDSDPSTHIVSPMKNIEEKNMTDAERALKIPNTNDDLKNPAVLPTQMVGQTASQPVQMNTYDILVFEKDDDGRTTQKKVDGVKATSAKELMMLYGAEGSKIQILREYGNSQQPQPMQQQPQPQQFSGNYAGTQSQQISFYQPPIPQQRLKEPPKFFEIGGVKCKLEDGKMFQEQWVRVDSTKYRLIADATNKVVSMNGKHLETLKWVQIEDGDKENG